MLRIGVVLSGCGVFDGSEIQEAVLTLLTLDRLKTQVTCFAPNKWQKETINHQTQEASQEQRNIMVEAARISRGKIEDLSQADAEKLDVLIIPGGMGSIKNLSDFAQTGIDCQIDADLSRLVLDMYNRKKHIGAICISPVLLPRIIPAKIRLTIGNDPDLIVLIEKMGGEHVVCPVDDIVIDLEHKVVTTPAYMVSDSISEVASGIEKLVTRLCELASEGLTEE